MTRVMIVDDSVVMRRVITMALTGEPAIEVVGSAANGKEALELIDDLQPDLMTLDIEMPELDGLQTVTALRSRGHTIPVIMFSTLTSTSAQATLDALALGASDYVTKPSGTASLVQAIDTVREQLLPKIRQLAGAPVRALNNASAGADRAAHVIPHQINIWPSADRRATALVIGASTGGPDAVATLVASLPERLQIPAFIVQHMPPVFTRLYAERLNRLSALNVREACEGDTPEPGTILVAPGDWHMAVAGSPPTVTLCQSQKENAVRPAADVLFRSAAMAYSAGTVAVVLTGMGQDGLEGARAIKSAGGRVIVQDESSSVVWGMPGAIAGAGLADEVLPIPQLAEYICQSLLLPSRPTATRGSR
jgi:two-component system, chemotaxis family, protein-glutamate methylesterase/glutaminase